MGNCTNKPSKKESTTIIIRDEKIEKKSKFHLKEINHLDINEFNLEEVNRDNCLNMMDILFVLDTTASMGSYIQKSMITICKIVAKYRSLEYDLKFALNEYKDHENSSGYVTKLTNLTTAKDLIEVLKQIIVSGGGDGPEAVMDGLVEGIRDTKWRTLEDGKIKSQRFVFHICDAPPHGIQFGQSGDHPQGCPCGKKEDDVKYLLEQNDVKYILVKANNTLDKMESIFKGCFKDQYSNTVDVTKEDISGNMWDGVLKSLGKYIDY